MPASDSAPKGVFCVFAVGIVFDVAKMTTSRQVKASAPIKDVAIITLNRPQKRNALSKELIRDFLYELNSASQNPTVRVIVITGSGSFFSGEKPYILLWPTAFDI